MKKMTLFAVLVMILAILMSGCKGQTTAQGAGETTDTQEVTAQTTDDTQASETTPSETQTETEAEETQSSETTLSETQTETEAEDTQSSETNLPEESDGEDRVRLDVCFLDSSHAVFLLTKEETETVKKFFYTHEMTIIDSPLDRVGPLMLFLGNDVLSTYYADLSFLDGIIDGRYVVVELSDAECREFQSIIESYVDVTQLP